MGKSPPVRAQHPKLTCTPQRRTSCRGWLLNVPGAHVCNPHASPAVACEVRVQRTGRAHSGVLSSSAPPSMRERTNRRVIDVRRLGRRVTGYARQSCPSPGMRVSHALHKGMRVSHALHRVCSSVMLSAFPSSRTRLLQSSSTPMRRSAGAARVSVTAMRRPAGLGSPICLATTRCQSPGKSTGSSA
jgi:hypothetical protein